MQSESKRDSHAEGSLCEAAVARLAQVPLTHLGAEHWESTEDWIGGEGWLLCYFLKL